MRVKLSTFLLISLVISIAASSIASSYFKQIAALERSKSTERLAEEIVQSFENVQFGPDDVQRIVDHAASSDRSVMFIDVAWSANSAIARRPFARFVAEFQHAHPSNPVDFHFVDCTSMTNGYAPFRSLPGWKELETNRQSLIHGNGEVVWMRGGKVLRVEQISNLPTASKLVQQTERILSLEHAR